ncbi:hypothetical protein ACHAWF_009683 [Thalassiosira exigua]
MPHKSRRRLLLLVRPLVAFCLLLLAASPRPARSWSPSTFRRGRGGLPRPPAPGPRPARPSDDVDGGAEALEALRSMRARELKSELEALGVSTRDALEKEELVRRLFRARTQGTGRGGGVGVDGPTATATKKKKKKKRRQQDDEFDDDVGALEDFSTGASDGNLDRNAGAAAADGGAWSIVAPFVYRDLEPSASVAARNADDVYIRPSPGKFAGVEVELRQGDDETVRWTLLVDTACSGLVLSPAAVARANARHPGTIRTSDGGATMTMAGSAQGASVARWDSSAKLIVGGVELDHANAAACQDVGALPEGLDGILGLSFLDRFACVDFDFARGELRLSKTDSDPPMPESGSVVAQGPLSMTKLRIYASDVTLDGRPVKLLVDTGAASSFLNWKGVSDMRLSKDSPQIEPIRDAIGAMGADNVALRLTHRFVLRRRWNLTAEDNAIGDFCPGVELRDGETSNVDIGDLPVLETLRGDGVGGILGADLLMRCDVVRFRGLNGPSPRMILMKDQ